MSNPNKDSSFTGWGTSFESHPQFSVLKANIDRAVHDLYLESLREQSEEFLHIFSDESQIEKFTNLMLGYWEEVENYEICGEILLLKESLIQKWKSLPKKKKTKIDQLRSWLKSTF
jgi:hypothetical protein